MSQAATTTTTLVPRVTVTTPTVPAEDFPFDECAPGLSVADWPLSTGVELPGFALPDGQNRAGGMFRLVRMIGEPDGYAEQRSAEVAAFAWLPASGQRESRGVVLLVGSRYFAAEAMRFLPSEAAPTLNPCRLGEDVVVAWYGIQAVGTPTDLTLYWVWQEEADSVSFAEVEG